LNNPWRGAEAWHYYILCQRQLYLGQFKSALKTALRLTDYELDMDAKKIYTLVALAAYYNKVNTLLFRVTKNAPEHLSNLKEWETQKTVKSIWTLL
jgi:WD repeat-containing protein 35